MTTTPESLSRTWEDLDLINRRMPGTLSGLTSSLVGEQNQDSLSFILSDSLLRAGDLSVVEPLSPEICTMLTYAAQAALAVCVVASEFAGETTVPLVLKDRRFELPTTGSTSTANAGRWIEAFNLAAITRQWSYLDLLCEVPTSALRASSTKSDEYVYRHVDVLKAFWRQDPNTSTLALEALAEVENFKIAPKQFAYFIGFRRLDLLYLLAIRDVEEFNAHFLESLADHKKYWNRNMSTFVGQFVRINY